MSRHHNTLNRNRWTVTRRAALDRDSWRCRGLWVGGPVGGGSLTPLEDGGAPYDPANLQTLCRGCHIHKTTDENRARRPVPPEVQRWRDLVREVATLR